MEDDFRKKETDKAYWRSSAVGYARLALVWRAGNAAVPDERRSGSGRRLELID